MHDLHIKIENTCMSIVRTKTIKVSLSEIGFANYVADSLISGFCHRGDTYI